MKRWLSSILLVVFCLALTFGTVSLAHVGGQLSQAEQDRISDIEGYIDQEWYTYDNAQDAYVYAMQQPDYVTAWIAASVMEEALGEIEDYEQEIDDIESGVTHL